MCIFILYYLFVLITNNLVQLPFYNMVLPEYSKTMGWKVIKWHTSALPWISDNTNPRTIPPWLMTFPPTTKLPDIYLLSHPLPTTNNSHKTFYIPMMYLPKNPMISAYMMTPGLDHMEALIQGDGSHREDMMRTSVSATTPNHSWYS